MCLIDIAVRENNVVYPLVHTGLGLMTQVVQCLTQAFLALTHFEENGELLGVESLIADVT